MKNKAFLVIALLLTGMVTASCRQKEAASSDEMAQRRLAQLPPIEQQEKARVTHQPEARDYPFEVYTWRPLLRDGRPYRIELLGRNLQNAKSLHIGDQAIDLEPSADGTRATGPYPVKAPEGLPMAIAIGDSLYVLEERFSTLKVKGLPSIQGVEFSWERLEAPARIPDVGGTEVTALRFDIQVSGYMQRDAPLTVFFGGEAIPNDQIMDTPELLTGYSFKPDRLVEGTVITVDFGEGLRVLAPDRYVRPPVDE